MTTSSRLQTLRRRRRQRGAAVFVVFLVITLLMGLAVFAVRSAGIASSASGYARQATQVHYINEFMFLTVVDLHDPNELKDMMIDGPNTGEVACEEFATTDNPTCWIRSFDDVQEVVRRKRADPTFELVDAPAAHDPGSLGYAPVEADMKVEFTDLHPSTPLRGHEVAGGAELNQQLTYVYVTVTAHGMVRPKQAAADTWDTESATSASIERSRGHIFTGPVLMQR